jgi:hypothetical protein
MNSDVLVGFKRGVEGAIALATMGSATTHVLSTKILLVKALFTSPVFLP